jgi:dTDP-4-dehydrorhamnose 3,5-epimerase
MHFQTPPYDHQKLVSCLVGRVLDVLVDLRRGSATFGVACALELVAARPQVVWVPKGLAHGFLSLDDGSCVTYKTDCEYVREHDAGIRWNSFSFTWPMAEEEMTISSRDQEHPRLSEFASPFVYEPTEDR